VPDGKIASYQDLKVWQSAMELAVKSYSLTKAFPKDEMFGLTSQIRRAAVSVAANIAEGYGRENRGSFVQFFANCSGIVERARDAYLDCEAGWTCDGRRRCELSGGQ
jgi:23S rRNA-intervening sequence protein